VAWGDMDNDGDIDLYVANVNTPNKLLRNDGAGVFSDATSGQLGDTSGGEGVAWGDMDNDGDLDLYLSNAGGASRLFRNDGGGTFVDIATGPLAGTNQGRGAAWGDMDNDGDLDLYVANASGANKLLRNDGAGTFVDATSAPLGDTGNGVGVAWGDVDNDGDLDLYLAKNGQANRLFRNEGGGAFVDATSGALGDPGSGHAVVWGDMDGDGDLDLYLANSGSANKLFRNEGVAAGNHWLHVDLVGKQSNRSGIGARVRVVAGGIGQIREISGGSGFDSQNSLTAEFGLGAATTVDSLIIRWPSGAEQWLTNVVADQVLEVKEASMVKTPPGQNVSIQHVGGPKITFANVFSGGVTTASVDTTGPELPSGVAPATDPPAYYDVATTATFDSATIEVGYDESTLTTDESSLQLLHYDPVPATWFDITSFLNSIANAVSGFLWHFSPFVLAHTPTVDVDDTTPVAALQLYPCQPNPFTNATLIRFDLPREARVDLRIHDVHGRLVRTLSEARTWPAGRHAVPWDGRMSGDQPARAGVYFYVFESGDFRAVRRMVLLR